MTLSTLEPLVIPSRQLLDRETMTDDHFLAPQFAGIYDLVTVDDPDDVGPEPEMVQPES